MTEADGREGPAPLPPEQLPLDAGAPRRPEPPRAAPLTEAAFQKAIIDLARDCGWLVQHAQPTKSRRGKWITGGTAGFPDLVLLRPPQLVFLELKRQDGTTTKAQRQWINRLQRVPGVQAFVVRPTDLGKVFGLLMRPAG